MKSFNEPTDSEVDAAVALLLSAPVHLRYFFDHLENPNWIGPLKRRAFFANPPALEWGEGGVVRYPIWPASKYLARMVAHAPEEVAEILRDIETENPSVLSDVLDAASKMPATIAATLASMVSKTITLEGLSLVFPEAIEFCVQMANGSQTEAAMNVAEVLFIPRFDKDREYTSLGPKERYFYVEGLKKVVPLLAVAAPGRFLKNLCKWLTASIGVKEYFGEHSPSDNSDHWRPAIEEHEQNKTDDFAGNLVGFVRGAFEQALDKGAIELDAVFGTLADQEYQVFTRLRVHLINRFAERDPELGRATMMDPEMFEASRLWLWHEYAMLMRRRFPMLLPSQQATWLDWIDRGPEESNFHWNAHAAGREATDNDRRAWADSWRGIRLHWIAPHLSGKRRALYEKVSADWEAPESCDFHYYFPPARHKGRNTFSVEQLTGLSIADALDKISEQQPSTRHTDLIDEETMTVAAEFGQYVGSNAEEFSIQAELLERLDPKPIYVYVRTFIEQMADAVKVGRKIDLAAVLRLCKWVVEQPLDGYGAYIPVDGVLWKLVDKDWQWTRYAICRLIRAVCDATLDGVPQYPLVGNCEAIGALLEPLAETPVKSHFPEEAAAKNLRVHDFLAAANNTPRGCAVDALVAYARWIAIHSRQKSEGRQILDAMLVVRKRLEWQIAPENASFEAFAVMGGYLALLYWIDESWVKANADRLFDLMVIEQNPTSAYGWAAWNSFLDWGQARASLYQILRPQYAYAVKHLPKAHLSLNSGRTPIHRLGEQLVVLYGRGDLATSSCNDEQLLLDFLQAADSDVRSETIAFAGSAIGGNETVSEAILERFQSLWNWYWPAFGERDVLARVPSTLFGTWFGCGQFPIAWRLKQLEAIVALPQIPDLAEQVAERLAKIAEAHSEHVGATTHILDRMIRVDKEGWRAYAWRKPAMKILKLAMHGDDAAKGVARRLIDDLGRRGYQEFGKLLQHGGAADDPG